MVFWKIHFSITFCKLDRKIIPDDLLKLQNNLPDFSVLLMIFPSFFFLSSQKSFISEPFRFQNSKSFQKNKEENPIRAHYSVAEKLFNSIVKRLDFPVSSGDSDSFPLHFCQKGPSPKQKMRPLS